MAERAEGTKRKRGGLLLKLVAGGVIGVVVLVALVVVLVFAYIDQIAKTGIEQGASYTLGVDTTLASANVGVMSGTFTMSGLNVSNPEGFKTPHFLNLNDASANISLGSLRSDLVEVPAVDLSGIDVYLEKKEGKANYKVILENLKRFETGEKKEPEPDAAPGQKFVIRTLTITDVNAHVDVLPIGGELTRAHAKIDQIVLTDVGTGGKPLEFTKLTDVIVKAILSSIASLPGNVLPGDIAGELGNALSQLQGLGDLGVNVAASVGGQAIRVAGAAGEAVQQLGEGIQGVGKAGEEAAEGVGEALEGVGNLLGGDKDKKDDGGGG